MTGQLDAYRRYLEREFERAYRDVAFHHCAELDPIIRHRDLLLRLAHLGATLEHEDQLMTHYRMLVPPDA